MQYYYDSKLIAQSHNQDIDVEGDKEIHEMDVDNTIDEEPITEREVEFVTFLDYNISSQTIYRKYLFRQKKIFVNTKIYKTTAENMYMDC